MSAMKEVVEKHFLHMEIIVNPKVRFPVPYLGILADCSLFAGHTTSLQHTYAWRRSGTSTSFVETLLQFCTVLLPVVGVTGVAVQVSSWRCGSVVTG